MGNIQQSLMETRSNLPAPTAPRLNFISVLAFVAPVALGALTTLWTLKPGGANRSARYYRPYFFE